MSAICRYLNSLVTLMSAICRYLNSLVVVNVCKFNHYALINFTL